MELALEGPNASDARGMNAQSCSDVEQRGWPKMREALVAMHAGSTGCCFARPAAVKCSAFAGHPEDLSPEDKELWPEKFPDEDVSVDANPWSWEQSAISILLPHLTDFTEAALYLKDHALEQGEGGSLEDLRAMRRLSVLCHEHHPHQSVGWHGNLGPRS